MFDNKTNMDYEVVLSSRIRFARNISDYPFLSKLDPTSAKEIIDKVKGALGNEFTVVDFTSLSPIEAQAYVENHSVSPEFAGVTIPHVLLNNDNLGVKVMVCEEDHIRLQCIKPELSLSDAYSRACQVDDLLGEKLNIAFDEKLGYLTHCPTNLGTGMRASVMVFLPALTITKKINSIIPQLPKVGLTIRGLYGEGSDAEGCIYQISNQITLGISEEATINKLNEVINQIAEYEKNTRNIMRSDNIDLITDKVCRSLGIMKNAYMLSSKEFISLYSDVRLGISLGIIKDIDYAKLDKIFVEVMPANLLMRCGIEKNEKERDIERAKYIKEKL